MLRALRISLGLLNSQPRPHAVVCAVGGVLRGEGAAPPAPPAQSRRRRSPAARRDYRYRDQRLGALTWNIKFAYYS